MGATGPFAITSRPSRCRGRRHSTVRSITKSSSGSGSCLRRSRASTNPRSRGWDAGLGYAPLRPSSDRWNSIVRRTPRSADSPSGPEVPGQTLAQELHRPVVAVVVEDLVVGCDHSDRRAQPIAPLTSREPDSSATEAAWFPSRGSGTPSSTRPHQWRPVWGYAVLGEVFSEGAAMRRRSVEPSGASHSVSTTIVRARLAM